MCPVRCVTYVSGRSFPLPQSISTALFWCNFGTLGTTATMEVSGRLIKIPLVQPHRGALAVPREGVNRVRT